LTLAFGIQTKTSILEYQKQAIFQYDAFFEGVSRCQTNIHSVKAVIVRPLVFDIQKQPHKMAHTVKSIFVRPICFGYSKIATRRTRLVFDIQKQPHKMAHTVKVIFVRPICF
jgi:hypothetical protein